MPRRSYQQELPGGGHRTYDSKCRGRPWRVHIVRPPWQLTHDDRRVDDLVRVVLKDEASNDEHGLQHLQHRARPHEGNAESVVRVVLARVHEKAIEGEADCGCER